MSEQIKYWKELSDYDIETAVAMLKSKRFLYVGFTENRCKELLDNTKRLQLWIKQKL